MLGSKSSPASPTRFEALLLEDRGELLVDRRDRLDALGLGVLARVEHGEELDDEADRRPGRAARLAGNRRGACSSRTRPARGGPGRGTRPARRRRPGTAARSAPAPPAVSSFCSSISSASTSASSGVSDSGGGPRSRRRRRSVSVGGHRAVGGGSARTRRRRLGSLAVLGPVLVDDLGVHDLVVVRLGVRGGVSPPAAAPVDSACDACS